MLHKVRKNFPEQRWDSFGGGAIKVKVENILKSSLDSIPSPSPLVKIQNMGGKLFSTKSLLTTTSNVLPLHLKQTFHFPAQNLNFY